MDVHLLIGLIYMTLQASGAISLENVQTEFGGAAPISITEYYGSGGAPSSGIISLSDFYGRSNAPKMVSVTSGSYVYLYANYGTTVNGAGSAYTENGDCWYMTGYYGFYWTFAITGFNLASLIPANSTLVGIKVFYKASITDTAFNYQANDLIFGNGPTILVQATAPSTTNIDGNNIYRQYVSNDYPDSAYGHTYGLTMANVLAPEFGVGLKITLDSGYFFLDNMAMHIFYR